jgi:hypothetical protein
MHVPDTDMEGDPSPPSSPWPNPRVPCNTPMWMYPKNNPGLCRHLPHIITTLDGPAGSDITTLQHQLVMNTNPMQVAFSCNSPDELNRPDSLSVDSSQHAPTGNIFTFPSNMHYSTPIYPGLSRYAELAKLAINNTCPTFAVGVKHCKGNSN